MKYMGSKRWMLSNGLGHLLDELAPRAERFVDLFSGSGVVSHHVAKKNPIPVAAYDLQQFSAVLTNAVIERCKKIEPCNLWEQWHRKATKIALEKRRPVKGKFTQAYVKKCRSWSGKQVSLPITKAYGGYYFSPEQAVWIDALRKTLPKDEPGRTVALAALIRASSQCAASPGHTAQPFQPTRTAKKFLRESWDKSVPERTKLALEALSSNHAQRIGIARVMDANVAVRHIRDGDLVFVDPPYSGVHYSRFYHVLETIAQGRCGEVSGVGRYPSAEKRPRSRFSVKTESVAAFTKLLMAISRKNARAIVTFPDHECSNGLSGEQARTIAAKFFCVTAKTVTSKFSTLGGTQVGKSEGNGRAARKPTKELILVLEPKGK